MKKYILIHKKLTPNQNNLPAIGDGITGGFAFLNSKKATTENGIDMFYPESSSYEFKNINGFPCIFFDGTSNVADEQSSADTPYIANNNMPGSVDITISYWFYLLDEFDNDTQYIIATNRNYSGYNKFFSSTVSFNGEYNMVSYARNYDNNPGPLNLNKIIKPNKWHNIIVTNSNLNISLWLDGEKYTQTITTGGYYIGQSIPKFITFFSKNVACYMSTLLIYGRSISDEEAKLIYGY